MYVCIIGIHRCKKVYKKLLDLKQTYYSQQICLMIFFFQILSMVMIDFQKEYLIMTLKNVVHTNEEYVMHFIT